MYIQYVVTALVLLLSFLINPTKTKKALRIALKKFLFIIPTFIKILFLIAIIFYFFPEETISGYLSSNNEFIGILVAFLIGSIAAIPGFIAFPLSGMLVDKGVSYTIIAMFTTSLMMIGVLTFPIEKKYFHYKIVVLRNIIGLGIAVIVTFIVSMVY